MPWWLFELILWFFLIVVGAAMIDIFTTYGRKVWHKKFLAVSVIGLLVAWGVIFYGSFIEPKILTVRHETIDLLELSQPVRIAVLSDVHVGPYLGSEWVNKIVKKTNEQNPDLILLLGDFVMGQAGKVEFLEEFRDLRAEYGVYAVLGNHDYDANRDGEIKKALENLGIKVLVNSSTPVKLTDGSFLWLAGIGDWWNNADLEEALNGRTVAENILLLSHNPDVVLTQKTALVDLVLSGHTHGGQIRLPWIGPVSNVPTILGREYSRGLFEINGSTIFITSGLGETGPRARLFNPPEIGVLDVLPSP